MHNGLKGYRDCIEKAIDPSELKQERVNLAALLPWSPLESLGVRGRHLDI